MECQLFLKCLDSYLQSAMMKFLNLVALVSSVFSEARYDKQITSSLPIAVYNPKPAYESSSLTPYNFSYEVKIDDYTSFGDVRVGDRQGKVVGTYHVQLPDGRHQRVTYKDEGKGYITDVKYDGEVKSNESKPADHKELTNSYGQSDNEPALNELPYEELSYKPLNYSNRANVNQLNDSENKKCKHSKTLCYEEPSYGKSNERTYTEPFHDSPIAVSYQEPSSATPSYKEEAYTTQVSYSKTAYDVPSSTSIQSPWRPITVTSANNNPVYKTEEYKTTSTSTSPEAPLTTPDYEKSNYPITAYKKTAGSTVTYEKPIYTTPAYKAPQFTTHSYKIRPSLQNPFSKSIQALKASYPITAPAYKKPVYFVRSHETPASNTPALKPYRTNIYVPKIVLHIPRAYKAASYQIFPKEPLAA